MGLKNVETVEKNNVVIEFDVNAQEFESAVDKAFKKNRNKISVQGFRKGKAPRKIIEKIYGEGIFYEDAINIVFPEAYQKAVEEAKLDVVESVETDIVEAGKEGCAFKVKVVVKPEVGLGEYKGLAAEKIMYTVDDNDVKAELERLQQRVARLVTVERPAKADDTVLIDYEGFCDGNAFEGGKADGYELKLGSNSFIPGFEDQIIGKNAGDAFDVTVTFPTEYHSEDLAGKEAIFKVKLHEVKETEVDELDDEFAKDVSEFETLEELKKSIKDKFIESRERQSQNQLEEGVIDKLLESFEAEIPQVMIEKEIDEITKEVESRLSMQGLNLEQYLHYTASTMETFRMSFREQAEKRVKVRLAMEKVVKLENITASEEDFEAEYKNLAEMYNMEASKIKTILPKENLETDICVAKAIKLIIDNAVVTEVPYTPDAEVKENLKKAIKKAAKSDGKKADEKVDEKIDEKKPEAAKKKTAAKKTAAKPTAKKKTEKKDEQKAEQ